MLVLVRHGESTANAEGLLLGRSDVPLTELGRLQASRVPSLLGPVGLVRTSPLCRASDTAAMLGGPSSAEADSRWIEIDYGDYEGLALSDVPPLAWERLRGDARQSFPGGESLADVGLRVREACEELFGEDGRLARAEQDVVVVSHVSPIKAAVAWALGVGEEVAWRLHLATGSVTRIAWGRAGPLLDSFNELPGPRGGTGSA